MRPPVIRPSDYYDIKITNLADIGDENPECRRVFFPDGFPSTHNYPPDYPSYSMEMSDHTVWHFADRIEVGNDPPIVLSNTPSGVHIALTLAILIKQGFVKAEYLVIVKLKRNGPQ